MNLNTLTLSQFRNYHNKTFRLSPLTIIIGKNTAGKTNILEGVYFLSHGTSFRADKDVDTIRFGSNFSKIQGKISNNAILEVRMSTLDGSRLGNLTVNRLSKKFTVNGVAKRQADFVGRLTTVLFSPTDIELITDTPARRRRFIDAILKQVSKNYRLCSTTYEKALKARNRLLHLIKEGKKIYSESEFSYWDDVLINNASVITAERKKLVDFINVSSKHMFSFTLLYDASSVTKERLKQYLDTEQLAGVTLIGPQRDDFVFLYGTTTRLVKEFCSRGEQRLTILECKLLEIAYLEQETQVKPLLLLDDIFSELDQENIDRITSLFPNQQTILTTTHQEFIPPTFQKNARVIELALE